MTKKKDMELDLDFDVEETSSSSVETAEDVENVFELDLDDVEDDEIEPEALPSIDEPSAKPKKKSGKKRSEVAGASKATKGRTAKEVVTGTAEYADGGIADLIVDVDDSVHYLTWLIYGKNGTGKTTLLSTTDGVLMLEVDKGTLSIKDKAKGKVKKIPVDKWMTVEDVYWLLDSGEKVYNDDGDVVGINIQTKGGKYLVKTVAFDTITKLADICLRDTVLGTKVEDATKSVIQPRLKDWGDMGQRMKYWLSMYKDLPLQKVWLMQENANSDEIDSDEYGIFPAINKSLRTYVMSEADIIGRTYIAKKGEKGYVFKLSCKPNDTYVTKDRTGVLSGAMSNPSLDKMYSAVFK